MPKRGENIRKRKDGRWEGRFISGYKSDGKAKYRSVYGGTYLETKKKLLQTHKTGVLPETRGSIHFREILFLWLDSKKLKLRPQTYAKYSQLIENHLAQGIGNYSISKVNASLVNCYIEEKMKNGRLNKSGGLSVSYVKTLAYIIRSSLQYAASMQYCQNMKGEIGTLPRGRMEYSIFTVEEQKRLVRYITSDLDGTKLGVLLCLYTGLRIGEICGLKWSDIDFQQKSLCVQRTVYRMKNPNCVAGEPKTKLTIGEPKSPSSYRVVPISSYLAALLLERKGRSLSEWVVVDEGNGILDPRTYQYRFKRYLKDCDIPNKNFHALRHAFATRCIEIGVDIKSLSEMLGHASINITLNTYVHSSLEHKRSQIELLDSIMGQKIGQ